MGAHGLLREPGELWLYTDEGFEYEPSAVRLDAGHVMADGGADLDHYRRGS